MKEHRLFQVLVMAAWCAACAARADEPSVHFNRDIRPILSENCFRCHGPDPEVREADLRLDVPQTAAGGAGTTAIVPGDSAASELIARVTSPDPELRMPPPEANKRLTKSEIEKLSIWIQQGAVYQRHWSFAPLADAEPPQVAGQGPASNPIDAFVAAELHEQGLTFSEPAAAETLLRRVTLDLTGLPPARADLRSFRAELCAPGADRDRCYEQVVDRLLASEHFGEHLAVSWLDAARYADTNGYFGDKPRQMWLWRDWVIQAFNSNMPFDQFTVEQLAGDLLPDSTLRQRIATGFNRNHMANNETGIIEEEFRTEYVVDRLHTTMTTWLGLTAGCAQCHDHKFDPISQREFYQLFAFFNNVPESGLIREADPPPKITVPSPRQEQQLATLTTESQAAEQAFAAVQTRLAGKITKWEQTAGETLCCAPTESLVFHEPFDGNLGPKVTSLGTALDFEAGIQGQAGRFDATQHVEAELAAFRLDQPWTIGFWMRPDGTLSCPLSLIEPDGDRRGIEVLYGKGLVKVHLVHRWGVRLIAVSTVEPITNRNWHQLVISYDCSGSANGLRIFIDGRRAKTEVRRDTLRGELDNSEPLRIGRRDSGLGYYGRLDEVRVLQSAVDEPAVAAWFRGERLRGILSVPASKRSRSDAEFLLDDYLDRFAAAEDRAVRDRARQARRAKRQLQAAIPTALVMQEMDQPRVTHVLQRGQYDQLGEEVPPGVPSALAPWPEGAPLNRLGFARWLVSPDNPLTARVAVNRFWQHCFGAGLVRTVDDFGSQGEPPTHPELLDWLAATFRDSGWDVKRLLKLIVTSRTYQQRAGFTWRTSEAGSHPEGLVDPKNRWLARGPSGRLSAEMIRDQALAVSGLLVRQVGGPSVRPYQPPGLWEAVSYNAEETYVPDTGAGLWRRSVYTYIKRQSPPPALLIFDGPTREKCTMHRPSTNTPLQALVMLNDDTFVEAARILGCRVLRESSDDDARLVLLWQTVLIRDPRPEELVLMRGLLQRLRARYAADPEAAQRLLSVGIADHDQACAADELAAWTVIAQTVLNLDEAITKR